MTRTEPSYRRCGECRGTGRVDSRDCPHCVGRGRHPANAEARADEALRDLRRERAVWDEVERQESARERWGPIFGGGY